jgi:hypothetical protein
MSYYSPIEGEKYLTEKEVKVTFRIPIKLRELVKEYIKLDLHMNESEFYRHAAMEKIQRDAPALYKKLFKKEV